MPSALWEAIDAGDVRRVELLITKGVNVNVRNKGRDGATALMFAAEGGNVDIVKALLAAGADINAKDDDGDGVLVWADDFDVIRLLIAAGADIDDMVIEGGEEGEIAKTLLKFLLAADETDDANVRNEDGDTMLIWATRRGHVAVVGILLALAELDIDAKDKDGRTARDIAVENNRADIVELFDSYRQEN